MSVIRERDHDRLLERIPLFPSYVAAYFHHAIPKLSPSSLLSYSYDYEIFFRWLIDADITNVKSIQEVSLETLEGLTTSNVDAFRSYLQRYVKPQKGTGRKIRREVIAANRNDIQKKGTIRTATDFRKMMSLNTLFRYLHEVAEDVDQYPLLKRNVIAKALKNEKWNVTPPSIPENKLFNDTEMAEFCQFVAGGYGAKITDKRAGHYFQLNKERDAAIIALIMYSALRVSEVVNLDIDDLDVNTRKTLVIGKGSKDGDKHPVSFLNEAVPFLKAYIDIREQRYRPERYE